MDSSSPVDTFATRLSAQPLRQQSSDFSVILLRSRLRRRGYSNEKDLRADKHPYRRIRRAGDSRASERPCCLRLPRTNRSAPSAHLGTDRAYTPHRDFWGNREDASSNDAGEDAKDALGRSYSLFDGVGLPFGESIKE
jgi:hypothetical protein